MKKVVLIVLAALTLVVPMPSAAQQYSDSEPTGLPPCEAGNEAFLFANWPCDPNAPVPPVLPPPVEPPISILPPCAPGNEAILFSNWPCDPSRPYIPPPEPTPPPCRPVAVTSAADPISPVSPPPCPTIVPPPPPPQPPSPPWYCPSWAWWCSQKPIVASYVALGDSVAYGLISSKGYVFRYQEGLEKNLGGTVDTQNMSAPGVSSEVLLANLTSNTIMRDRLARADYITWNVGGKDLLDAREHYQTGRCGGGDNQNCLRQSGQQLKNNWDGIVAKTQSLRRPAATVATMDIYNPFVDEDRARDSWPNDAGSDFEVFKLYLDDINRHLRTSSASAGIHIARVYLAFNGPAGTIDPDRRQLISFDGFHPNDKGHALIAELLLPGRVYPLAPEE